MSYTKAMRHARNVRKSRAQSKMHFGFDTGSGRWPSGWANPAIRPLLEIRHWWRERRDPRTRAAIREAVSELRAQRIAASESSTEPRT